jgi:hypothetical protein
MSPVEAVEPFPVGFEGSQFGGSVRHGQGVCARGRFDFEIVVLTL